MTVTIYTTPSCSSCRKAQRWFENHGIAYRVQNMLAQPLTLAQVKGILQLTEHGTEDIISKRSRAYRQLQVDLDDLSLRELYHLIQESPTILRRPIMVDDRRLQVGFHMEDIRRFLPRDARIRTRLLAQAQLNLAN